MKTTVSACILAMTLTATMMARPQGEPSAAPSVTDKVVINGWALSMGTVAPVVEPETAGAFDPDLPGEETGRPAA